MPFAYKHERKINECYPSKPGEEGPVAGKISSLAYYINSRPSKLLKVSRYLQKKVRRDVSRERTGYNKVTLDIVESIMKLCSEYFSTFAPTALIIIEELSKSGDRELTTKAVNTFASFCAGAKPILGSFHEDDFFTSLTNVTKRFASLGFNPMAISLDAMLSPEEQLTWRQIGILGINSVIEMDDFKTEQAAERIEAIIFALVGNLSQSSDLRETSVEDTSASRSRGMSLIQTVSVETDMSLARMSLRALETMIKKSNGVSISLIMNSLLKQFNTAKWQPESLCIFTLNTVYSSAPSQYLFLTLSEIFKYLDHSNPSDVAVVTLTHTIIELLKSNRGPLGYSAIELCNNFLRLLRRQKQGITDSPSITLQPSSLQYNEPIMSICQVILALLKNTNFAAQKYEIIGHVINKSFLITPGERRRESMLTVKSLPEKHSMATVTLDSMEESQIRSMIWNLLQSMAAEKLPGSILKFAFMEVPTKLFEALFALSLHPNPEIRANGLALFHTLLRHGLSISGYPSEIDSEQFSSSLSLQSVTSIPSISVNAALFARCRAILFESIMLDESHAPHIILALAILDDLLKDGGLDHILSSASLVLTLQGQLSLRRPEHLVLVKMLVASHLLSIAMRFKNIDLQIYVKKAREDSFAEHTTALRDATCWPELTVNSTLDEIERWWLPPLTDSVLQKAKQLMLDSEKVVDLITQGLAGDHVKAMIDKIFGHPYSTQADHSLYQDSRLESRKTYFELPKKSDTLSSRRSYISFDTSYGGLGSSKMLSIADTKSITSAASIVSEKERPGSTLARQGVLRTKASDGSSLDDGASIFGSSDGCESPSAILPTSFESAARSNLETKKQHDRRSHLFDK